MIYNNRTYPHPVLGIGDDVGGNLEVSLKVESDGQQIRISPSFSLLNKDLQHLIESQVAQFVSHVYCRGTMFRRVYSTWKYISEVIIIEAEKLHGEVEIDFFVCAVQNIESYNNSEFNLDYSGYSFSIDKGDILAYGGKGRFHANKSPEDLKSVSALMNIQCMEKKGRQPMYNDYDEKISIMLCEEDFEFYQTIKNNSSRSWNILLSSIVLPALIEALHYVDSSEGDNYSETQWYKVLKDTIEQSKDKEKIKIAQRILEHPNHRSFEALVQLIEER